MSRTMFRSLSSPMSMSRVIACFLAELSGKIPFRQLFPWVLEQARCLPILNKLSKIEERRIVGDSRRLLHVVGYNHDCVFFFDAVNELLDLRSRDRVKC